MAVEQVSVTEADIAQAEQRLTGRVRETPVLPAGELSRRAGVRVWLKAESLQLTGAFKIRGATNAILRLAPERLAAGVVAASAGNHGQAVAFAAREAGAHATIVMPAGAPLAKVAAVRGYGGEVRFAEGSYDDAGRLAAELAAEHGMTPVHPFDAPDVVAGQGTVGLEIARQAPDTKLVLVPLGGGGLAGGIGVAIAARLTGARVVGVQSEACAPYVRGATVPAAPDPAHGRPVNTICDGIAVKRPGAVTLPLVERYLDEVVTVTDDEVAEAMVLLLERSKLVAEGAGAVGVAALLQGRVAVPNDGAVCVVVSGANVDAALLAECIRIGETSAGRRMVISTIVPDRPGALSQLLETVARTGANVVDVNHLREGVDLHVRETVVQLVVQVRGRDHGHELVEAVGAAGFELRLDWTS